MTAMQAKKRAVVQLDDSDDDVQLLNASALAPRGYKKQRKEATTPAAPATSCAAPSTPTAPTATTSTATSTSSMPSFKITVDALTRFKTFYPERATTALATQYQSEILSVMHAYQTSSPLHLQHRYTVMRATSLGSSADFTTSVLSTPTPSLSYANALLLEMFPALNPRVGKAGNKPVYLWLTAKAGIKNPRFAHLHAVRYNEVGCGMDEDGCLSMCVVELRGEERFTGAMYVIRESAEDADAKREREETERNEMEEERGATAGYEEVAVEEGGEDGDPLFWSEGQS